MASVKTRAALVGGKYLVTHPRGRVARWAFRFAVRRLSRRLAVVAPGAPPTAGRVVKVAAVTALAVGGVAFVVRRRRRRAVAEATPTPAPPMAFVPEARGPDAAAPVREAPTHEAATPAPFVPEEPAPVTFSPPVPAPAADEFGPAPDAADDALVARVEARLFGEAAAPSVKVEVSSGVVTLRGEVDDEEAERVLVKDAERVEGVKAVQSELETAGTELGPPAR